MELTIDNRKKEINEQYKLGLSFWDMIFWQNWESILLRKDKDEENKKSPGNNKSEVNQKSKQDKESKNRQMQVNSEAEVKQKLDEAIDKELSRFFDIKNNPNYFEIATENNPELDRYFNGQIDALVAGGQAREAEYAKQNSALEKQNMAKTFGEKQFEEYEKIFNVFAKRNYPASFKCLLLNEALQNSYRMDYSDKKKPHLIVNARKPNQTILGFINLPAEVMDFIYNNAPKYSSFKALYKDAQVEHKKHIAQTNSISFENVNTFGKGHWMKFASKQSDPENFETNVAALKATVADTPWCTNALASVHLSEGDFYVFVDNKDKAHIAVKMNGNAIGEVRGVKNGSAQDLEDEYRDVALNFLENNKEIKNGKKWFEKEEWNKRLVNYKQQIENGTFKETEVENLIEDLNPKNSELLFDKNNQEALKKVLPLAVPTFAKHFNCVENEVCAGDYKPTESETTCPYKVILGSAKFFDSQITDLGNLQCIIGEANFGYSKITDLGNLQRIGGSVSFSNSQIKDTGKLEKVGGNIFVEKDKFLDIDSIKQHSGNFVIGDVFDRIEINSLKEAKEYMHQKFAQQNQTSLEEANDIMSQFKERNQQNNQNNKNANPNNNPVA